MQNWRLYLTESGDFARQGREHVLGGVLVETSRREAHEDRIGRLLRRAVPHVPVPSHPRLFNYVSAHALWLFHSKALGATTLELLDIRAAESVLRSLDRRGWAEALASVSAGRDPDSTVLWNLDGLWQAEDPSSYEQFSAELVSFRDRLRQVVSVAAPPCDPVGGLLVGASVTPADATGGGTRLDNYTHTIRCAVQRSVDLLGRAFDTEQRIRPRVTAWPRSLHPPDDWTDPSWLAETLQPLRIPDHVTLEIDEHATPRSGATKSTLMILARFAAGDIRDRLREQSERSTWHELAQALGPLGRCTAPGTQSPLALPTLHAAGVAADRVEHTAHQRAMSTVPAWRGDEKRWLMDQADAWCEHFAGGAS